MQVGALPLEGAQVVIESISVDKKTLNPNGLVFFPARRPGELAGAAKAQEADLVQVTCFVADARVPTTQFPGVAVNQVQPTRLAIETETSCEGVGRLQRAGKSPGKLVFTGIQMAFGDQDQALRLAYGRLGRALEAVKVRSADSLVLNIYSVNRNAAEKAAALVPDFLGSKTPVYTTRVVEGLPSLDAAVAIELVALGP